MATYLKLYNIESSPLSSSSIKPIAQREQAKKITISALGLGSGRLEKSVNLHITKFYDIVNVIIPFF
jgi:hypothetical protein